MTTTTDAEVYIVISPNGDVELLDAMPRWNWEAEGQTVRVGHINGGDSAPVPMPPSHRATTWTPSFVRLAADWSFSFTGSRAELCAELERRGFEVEDFTDQVDAYRRDAAGRRRRALTLMA